MRIQIYILATVVAVALALAPAAGAHVTLQPPEAPAGGFTRLDVRVPNERDNAGTTKVEVQFPPGFLFVSYEPIAGLGHRDRHAQAGQAGRAVRRADHRGGRPRHDHGRRRHGWIQPGQFKDFGLSLAMPEGNAGSKLTFKALQTYSNGEVVRWIGPPDSEEPAPQVELAAAEGEEAAPPPAQQQQAPAASEEDDEGNGLAIVALVVGAAGLAAGLAALLMARRRTKVGAA